MITCNNLLSRNPFPNEDESINRSGKEMKDLIYTLISPDTKLVAMEAAGVIGKLKWCTCSLKRWIYRRYAGISLDIEILVRDTHMYRQKERVVPSRTRAL